ncbi:MAG TPA: hypothetical protein VK027_08650 [Chitinophagaceae bacterium]|nr:hypothetical protein [Chitinophagaceae bacterium]
MKKNKYFIHLSIAEKGKYYALSGDHNTALKYYREAIKMTQKQSQGSIFLQHYSQCIMESLQAMKAYEEVIIFCNKLLELIELRETNKTDDYILKYKDDIRQRKALQYLFLGDRERAREIFQIIKNNRKKNPFTITNTLLEWILKGYHITTENIENILKKEKFYIVNKNNLQPELYTELPMDLIIT